MCRLQWQLSIIVSNHHIATPFPIWRSIKIKKTFCTDLDIRLVFTPFKIRSLFGSMIQFLQVYVREWSISFLAQAVVPVILVRPTDTSPDASLSLVLRQTFSNLKTLQGIWKLFPSLLGGLFQDPWLCFHTLSIQVQRNYAHPLGTAFIE